MASRAPENFPEAKIAEMNDKRNSSQHENVDKIWVLVFWEVSFFFSVLQVLLQYKYKTLHY